MYEPVDVTVVLILHPPDRTCIRRVHAPEYTLGAPDALAPIWTRGCPQPVPPQDPPGAFRFVPDWGRPETRLAPLNRR
jgi:hypothetical protein